MSSSSTSTWRHPPLDCPPMEEGRKLLKEKRYGDAVSCFQDALSLLEKASPETLKVETNDGSVTTTTEVLVSTQLYLLKALDSLGERRADEVTIESNLVLERITDGDHRSQCHPALITMACQSLAKCKSNRSELRIKACRRVLEDPTCGTSKQRRLFYEVESSIYESQGNLEAAAASTEALLEEFPGNQMNRKRLREIQTKLGLIDIEQEQRDEAKREKQRAHKKRTRQRRKLENLERLQELLALLSSDIDETLDASTKKDFFGLLGEDKVDSTCSIDWTLIPVEITPEASLKRKKDVRVKRKLRQLEALFTLLRQVIDSLMAKSNYSKDRPLHIVDFGSGSGNSCLVFAHLLRDLPCRFTLVDIKPQCVSIGKDRTEKAGLDTSVAWKCGDVDSFDERFDIGLATHLCGGATDVALSKCIDVGASFIATPCCLGSIKFALGNDTEVKTRVDGCAPVLKRSNDLTYPRSKWLRDELTLEEYAAMTSLGDCTVAVAEEGENELRMKGKRLLDADRLALAREAGYGTSLGRLGSKDECGPKSDVLLGICGLCKVETS